MEIWKSQNRRFPDSPRRDGYGGLPVQGEQTTNHRAECVTHVPGLKCYPCAGPYKWSKIIERQRRDTVLKHTRKCRGWNVELVESRRDDTHYDAISGAAPTASARFSSSSSDVPLSPRL